LWKLRVNEEFGPRDRVFQAQIPNQLQAATVRAVVGEHGGKRRGINLLCRGESEETNALNPSDRRAV